MSYRQLRVLREMLSANDYIIALSKQTGEGIIRVSRYSKIIYMSRETLHQITASVDAKCRHIDTLEVYMVRVKPGRQKKIQGEEHASTSEESRVSNEQNSVIKTENSI